MSGILAGLSAETRTNGRLLKVPDTETAKDMLVHPNDNLVGEVAIIPIVNRLVGSYARSCWILNGV